MFKTNLSTIILIYLIVIINTPISSQAKIVFNPCPPGTKTGCTPKGPTGGGSRKRITTALIIKSKSANNTTNQTKKDRYILKCTKIDPKTKLCKPTKNAIRGGGSR